MYFIAEDKDPYHFSVLEKQYKHKSTLFTKSDDGGKKVYFCLFIPLSIAKQLALQNIKIYLFGLIDKEHLIASKHNFLSFISQIIYFGNQFHLSLPIEKH